MKLKQVQVTFNRWLVVAGTLYIIGVGFTYWYFQARVHSQRATSRPAASHMTVTSRRTPIVVTVPFLVNTPLRATITQPASATTVQSDAGWVTLEGTITAAKPGERFFVVVESADRQNYLQPELRPEVEGSWHARVKYGSLGHRYKTYVIASQDAAAIERLKVSPAFTGLPSGFEVVSAVTTYTVQ